MSERYMIDFPDPHNPGAFISEGPFTEEAGKRYLCQWYGDGTSDEVIERIFWALSSTLPEGVEEDS